MPNGGYSQKRVTRFTRMNGNDQVDEEGTLTTNQTIRLEKMKLDGKNTWVCTNDTILEANFKEGSVLLQADALTMSSPSSVETVFPFESGLKNYVQLVSVQQSCNGVQIAQIYRFLRLPVLFTTSVHSQH